MMQIIDNPAGAVNVQRTNGPRHLDPSRMVAVVHISVSPEGFPWARNVARLCTGPKAANGSVASYHVVTDDRETIRIMADDQVPFAAPPLNQHTGLHVCIAAPIQTRAGWLDDVSVDSIRRTGLVIAQWSQLGLLKAAPAVQRTTSGMLLAGQFGGYCGHVDVSNAWHQTNHTDPGDAFPWDVLDMYVNGPKADRETLSGIANPAVMAGLMRLFDCTPDEIGARFLDFRHYFGKDETTPADEVWQLVDFACDWQGRHRIATISEWTGHSGRVIAAP